LRFRRNGAALVSAYLSVQRLFALTDSPKPRIEILYCRQCQWLLRAAWYAQELLTTFSEELGEVAIQPGTGGVFQVTCNGKLLWDRKSMNGFPDIKQLKQLVRDEIAPDRSLGHVDRQSESGEPTKS
jgi:selenoprotein W-related protein